jgi:hypothetical protein
MQHLLQAMTAQLSASWDRRHEIVRRFREDDRGSITVEAVLWIAGLSVLALTVGTIIYGLVIAKANSIHL